MDRNQADLTFLEIVDGWLRERLSGGQGGILAEMVLHSPGETVALIHKIAENLRRRRTLSAPPVSALGGHLTAFRQAAADFAGFMDGAVAAEPETAAIVERLAEMATALANGPDPATPAGLVQLLTSRPHPDLCTKAGAFASFRKKGKWTAAAKQAGLSKADGDRLNDAAEVHYTACCDAWVSLVQAAAGHALAALIDETRPILQRYRDHKRASAQLDFDDLIFAARDLLRDHDAVRRALGQRFAHVLVDEFQDTDPLQTEIFWRLCGEPVDGGDDWTRFQIRSGALFLVGDPKQAIYRFRGADVGAYVTEVLSAMPSVQSFGQERREGERFAGVGERTFDSAKRRILLRAAMTSIVIVLIFGMLAVGLGLESAGTVDLIVDAALPLLTNLSPLYLLLAIYLLTSVLTETVTNNAVAVIMTPIVLALATDLGVEPRPLLFAVMFAASASFATPVGYQTTTIVYAAGNYRCADFLKIGAPMNVVVGLATCLAINAMG